MSKNGIFFIGILFLVLLAVLLTVLYRQQPATSSSPSKHLTSKTTKPPSSPIEVKKDVPQNFVRNLNETLTYSQRYAKCIDLKKFLSKSSLKQFFQEKFVKMMSSTPKRKFNELVLLRIHKRKFTLDFWLNTCSLILEIIDDDEEEISRHIFLFTLVGHESAVPDEFKPFIKPHNEDKLADKYTDRIYTDGYQRGGDLASADFLISGDDDKSSSEKREYYDFVWSIEHDVRFAGISWSDLFYNSRFVIGRMRKDVLVEVEKDKESDQTFESATDTPRQYQHEFKCHRNLMMMSNKRKSNSQNDDSGNLPHLVFFYPPIVNEGFLDPVKQHLTQFHDNNKRKQAQRFPRLVPIKHTWHFANEVYFQGSWKKLWKKKTQQTWIGALMPIFGMSKQLAAAIVRDGLAGNSHVNQEVVLPLTAQLEKLKMITTYGCFPSQYYFSWMRRKETAPVYLEWGSSYFLANSTNGDDENSSNSNNNNEDLVDFRQGVRHAPQIGFDLYMRTKKITRNSAAFYGVLTKEFVGDDKVGHMLFHPVKL